MNLLVIRNKAKDKFKHFIDLSLEDIDYEIYKEGIDCRNRKILFVVELNSLGYDFELLNWLESINDKTDYFKGSTGSIIIKSDSDLYTKSMAQDIILHANTLGLSFIGHSVIEITNGYKNFETWHKTIDLPLKDIAVLRAKELLDRLKKYEYLENNSKKILALHSSSYKTSNTLGLWHLVKENLKKINNNIEEIHIENGTVVDCKGCDFSTCIHFGKQHSCFYGGIMVKEVLPAIEVSDIIVWICPNYNDSISSNMLAVINRLTVLYRQITFHNKSFFAVIVSGNSGSDLLAKQLIGALNINKGFILPPYFTIMETANDPLKILKLKDIKSRAKDMAERIY